MISVRISRPNRPRLYTVKTGLIKESCYDTSARVCLFGPVEVEVLEGWCAGCRHPVVVVIFGAKYTGQDEDI